MNPTTLNSEKVLQSKLPIIGLVLVLLVASGLRFWELGKESYWVDEVIMVQVTSDPAVMWHDIQLGRPPIYTLAGSVWVSLFGTSEVATRSLSAVIGILSVLTIFLVGQKLFDRQIGLLSAIMMALSAFQLYWSQEYRYYSLLILMSLLMVYFFLRALDRRRVLDFGLYALFSILTFYTHAHGLFVLAAPATYFVLRFRKYKAIWKPWFIAQCLIFIVILPGIFNLLSSAGAFGAGDVGSPSEWIPVPVVFNIYETLLSYLLRDTGYYLNRQVLPVVIVELGLIVVGLVLFTRKQFRHWLGSFRRLPPDIGQGLVSHGDSLLLVLLWLLLPIVAPFILSYIVAPLYLQRYTSAASSALYLLVAFGLLLFRRVFPPALMVLVVAVAFVPQIYFYYGETKEQWRDAAARVAEQAQPGDVIVYARDVDGSTQLMRGAFEWYYSGTPLPYCEIGEADLADPALSSALDNCLGDSQRVWLIMRKGSPEELQSLANHILSDPELQLNWDGEQDFNSVRLALLD